MAMHKASHSWLPEEKIPFIFSIEELILTIIYKLNAYLLEAIRLIVI